MEMDLEHLKLDIHRLYGIGAREITLIPSMYQLFKIDAYNNKHYILKTYKPNEQSCSHLRLICTHLSQIKNKGVNVPTPIAGNDDEFVQLIDGNYAVLSHFINGEEVSIISLSHCYSFGKECARLHSFGDNRLPLPNKYMTELLTNPLATILTGYAHRQRESDAITFFAQQADEKLSNIKIPAALCHGDYHWGNAIFQSNSITIIDFDLCCNSWRIYDAVVFLWNLLFDGDNDVNAKWHSFINGYQSISPLSPNELRSIPWLLVAHNIWHIGYIGNCKIDDWDFDDYWLDRKFKLFSEIEKMFPVDLKSISEFIN